MSAEEVRRRLRILVQGMVASALIGALYTVLGDRELTILPRGLLAGAIICGFVLTFELFVVGGAVGRWLQRRPFVLVVLIKAITYTVLIMAALGTLGFFYADRADDLMARALAALQASTERADLLFSLAISLGFNVVLSLNDILGRGVLLNFLTGRYHSPREETRIFLMVDLIGSTAAAERLGNMRFHQYLNRFFQVIGASILDHGGRIHRYVGDGMIVDWPLRNGLKQGRCLRAVREARRVLADCEQTFVRDFGERPDFRAVLHGGPVVTGEMGGAKREIVFLGSTLNTAARMETHAKQCDERVLVSCSLIDALKAEGGLDRSLSLRPLGAVDLRGVTAPLELVAIDF